MPKWFWSIINSNDTTQPTSREDLRRQFHESVDEILDKYPMGYEETLELLMIAGILADGGIKIKDAVDYYLEKHTVDPADINGLRARFKNQ